MNPTWSFVAPISYHRLFYLSRGVFGDGQFLKGRCEKNGAPGMAKSEGASNVLSLEDVLHRNRGWLEPFDYLADSRKTSRILSGRGSPGDVRITPHSRRASVSSSLRDTTP